MSNCLEREEREREIRERKRKREREREAWMDGNVRGKGCGVFECGVSV